MAIEHMFVIYCPNCDEKVITQVEGYCMVGNIIIEEAMGYCGCGKEFAVVGGEFEWIEE